MDIDMEDTNLNLSESDNGINDEPSGYFSHSEADILIYPSFWNLWNENEDTEDNENTEKADVKPKEIVKKTKSQPAMRVKSEVKNEVTPTEAKSLPRIELPIAQCMKLLEIGERESKKLFGKTPRDMCEFREEEGDMEIKTLWTRDSAGYATPSTSRVDCGNLSNLKETRRRAPPAFVCRQCSTEFSVKSLLTAHYLIHANDAAPKTRTRAQSAGRQYNVCKYCDRVFDWSRTLQEHLRNHCTSIPPLERRKLAVEEQNSKQKLQEDESMCPKRRCSKAHSARSCPTYRVRYTTTT